VVCSSPCQGCMISVQRLVVSTSVQVHNVASLDEEALQMYFESRRSGGSGELKSWTFDAQKGYAIVEFHDQQSTSPQFSLTHSLTHSFFSEFWEQPMSDMGRRWRLPVADLEGPSRLRPPPALGDGPTPSRYSDK